MKTAIVGAGAMGTLFAGYLAANDVEVSLIDIDPNLIDTINTDGIRIDRSPENDIVTELTATSDPSEVGEVDIVFIFVKSIHTRNAIEDAMAIIGDETTVITLQNGLRNLDIIKEYVSEDQILAGYTEAGSNTVEPGHVRQMGPSTTKIGGIDSKRAKAAASLLVDAGIDVTVVDDPISLIWDKQVVNVGVKPVAALTELRNEDIAKHDETRQVVEAVIEEAIAVANAKGIEILDDNPIERTFRILRETGSKKSSILEDVEREQKTEIDHINGAIVEYGKEEGIPTPNNRVVANLVLGKEKSYLK